MNEEKNTNYYLGIDWGRSKIGLAIAEDEMRIASAFEELDSKSALSEIRKQNEKFKFEKIILGWTKQGEFLSNSETIKEKEEFEKSLKQLGIFVEREEESFSTRLAQQNLSETGQKGISKKDNVESARIILQGWLDRNK